ncbi:carboxymuconolactone decarboxylase family protein [Persephonella sp.]|uniref:carboxymuconolactone decarboxylase family protein n=1 Tax=Persephonella sp. TaxID=2060922 RepID=UPI0025F92564|nr:carboxymuconolactone decarboxylase family protein [Persephonella sp.]
MAENNDTKIDMELYYKRFLALFEEVKKDYPKFVESFMGFFKATEGPGVLDKKTKELISIALSVKSQCPYCIAFHVKNAVAEGATRAEIIESAMVATLMGGGPCVAYMKYVFDACDQFGAK